MQHILRTGGIALIFLMALGVSALAVDERGVFSKRTAIFAFANKCGLLSDSELLAVKSGQLQARGALLRSGILASEVNRLDMIARQSVIGIDCENPEALAEIDRVKTSHSHWLKMKSLEYPGQYRSWQTRRDDVISQRHWRTIQEIEKADTGSVLLGSSILDGQYSLDIVIENQPAPRSVLLRMRDPQKLPNPPNEFLRKLLKLPMKGVSGLAPPDSATNTYFATHRVMAETGMLSASEGVSGVRFGFDREVLQAFSELEPTEAISIDLYWSNGLGKPDRHKRLYAEVGDFMAARIFAEAND